MIYENKKGKIRLFLILLLCNPFFISGCKKKSYIERKAEYAASQKNYYKKYKNNYKKSKEKSKGKSKEKSGKICKECFVDIGGAVKKPGVYSLKRGKRVFDVIEKAGGLLENSYIKDLNQAKKVEDGEKIYIYTVEEYKKLSLEEQNNNSLGRRNRKKNVGVKKSGRKTVNKVIVDINTAGKDELMTLPGVGESKARSIISCRERKGPFRRKEDLMNIAGIKNGVYNKLKDIIRVN